MFQDQSLAQSAKITARLDALDELAILDTQAEPEFDAITEAAARIAGCKISLISLLDQDRQWFKSRHNVAIAETPIDWAFCRYAVDSGETLVVGHAGKDSRFAQNPLVTGDPNICFYAGIPIKLKRHAQGESVALGTLCVIDSEKRTLSKEAMAALTKLARLTEALLEARLAHNRIKRQSENLNLALLEKGRMQRQLHQAERLAGIGSWRFTLDSTCLQWSPQIHQIYELPIGQSISVEEAIEFFPEPDRSRLNTAIEECASSGRAYDLELDFITAKSRQRRVRAIGELELCEGKPEALIGVFQDVTERYDLERKLKIVAQTDHLTQLPGRRGFSQWIEETIAQMLASNRPLALALIDLDHFKQVNDNHGHAAGDQVLRNIAGRLSYPWLRGSFAARLGGDEFVLVITDPELLASIDATIARLSQDLRVSHCSGAAFATPLSGNPPASQSTTGATIGVAFLDPDDAHCDALLAQADKALYRAKAKCRGSAYIGQKAVTAGVLPA